MFSKNTFFFILKNKKQFYSCQMYFPIFCYREQKIVLEKSYQTSSYSPQLKFNNELRWLK